MTAKKRPYYGGSRKPTGTLIRNKTGYSAKIWADVDGERVDREPITEVEDDRAIRRASHRAKEQ